jgi:hypothetical protein
MCFGLLSCVKIVKSVKYRHVSHVLLYTVQSLNHLTLKKDGTVCPSVFLLEHWSVVTCSFHHGASQGDGGHGEFRDEEERACTHSATAYRWSRGCEM